MCPCLRHILDRFCANSLSAKIEYYEGASLIRTKKGLGGGAVGVVGVEVSRVSLFSPDGV